MIQPKPQNFDEFASRLGSVETVVAGIEARMESGFKKVDAALSEITQEFRRSQRPNFGLWVMTAGLFLTMLGSFWFVIDMKVRSASTPIVKSLEEVEMQFNADSQIRNEQSSQQQRLNQVLWDSSPLGKLTKYPEAPYSEPNVSTQRPDDE